MTVDRAWIVRLQIVACRQWLKGDPFHLDRAADTLHSIRLLLEETGHCREEWEPIDMLRLSERPAADAALKDAINERLSRIDRKLPRYAFAPSRD